jgi:hypothetical protein
VLLVRYRLCFALFVTQWMGCLLGAYSSWFASHPNPSAPVSGVATPVRTPIATPAVLPFFGDSLRVPSPQPHRQQASQTQTLLLAALSYVVSALPNPALCLQAGVALRNLCDSNRKALAPHIAAFGELHSGLGSVPVSYLFFLLVVVENILVDIRGYFLLGFGEGKGAAIDCECCTSVVA